MSLFPEMIDYLADAMRDEPELFDDDTESVDELADYSIPFPVIRAKNRIVY